MGDLTPDIAEQNPATGNEGAGIRSPIFPVHGRTDSRLFMTLTFFRAILDAAITETISPDFANIGVFLTDGLNQ
jgi:hypothetical protein